MIGARILGWSIALAITASASSVAAATWSAFLLLAAPAGH